MERIQQIVCCNIFDSYLVYQLRMIHLCNMTGNSEQKNEWARQAHAGGAVRDPVAGYPHEGMGSKYVDKGIVLGIFLKTAQVDWPVRSFSLHTPVFANIFK